MRMFVGEKPSPGWLPGDPDEWLPGDPAPDGPVAPRRPPVAPVFHVAWVIRFVGEEVQAGNILIDPTTAREVVSTLEAIGREWAE